MRRAPSDPIPIRRAPEHLGVSGAQVVCFERLDAPSERSVVVRCVALRGRGPGLSLGPDGEVRWQSGEREGCLVAVSADAQVVLWRPRGAVAVRLCRAGRELRVPDERVVVMLDQDELVVGTARLRVHLHGLARRIHAPFRLRLGRAASAAAVAGALGAGLPAMAMTTAGCEREPTTADVTDGGIAGASSTAAATSSLLPLDGAVAGDGAAHGDSVPPTAAATSLGDAGSVDGSASADASARTTSSHASPTKAVTTPTSRPPGRGRVPKPPPIDVRLEPPFVD